MNKIGMKKLTDRQRELLARVVVGSNNVANFDGPQIPDWKALKDVMIALGGKWKSRVGFEFADDVYVHEVLRVARESGEILDPKAADFFATPRELARQVCEWAELKPEMDVLEPSAGQGALALMAKEICDCDVDCIEPLEANRKILERNGLGLAVYTDFLAAKPRTAIFEKNGGFDRVIMNPPFSKRADILHVTHAMRFLKPGGILVAIMSAGVEFRDDSLARQFRELMAANAGELRRNPDGSFKREGTMVRTVMVKMRKGG